MTKFKKLLGLAALCFASASQAAPVIYNNSIPAGTAAFDSAIASVGGTVTVDTLNNLASNTNTWARSGYTITSTNGSNRPIDTNYFGDGSDSIGINPSNPAPGSGITFTFATGVNAFGLEIGDWATCCFPSALFIAFNGGSSNLVANATTGSNNPGIPAGQGYENFVAAIDTTSTFTSVTFYGNGFGEYLVAGGHIRYSTLPVGTVVPTVPEPAALGLLALGLLGLVGARRRKKAA